MPVTVRGVHPECNYCTVCTVNIGVIRSLADAFNSPVYLKLAILVSLYSINAS